MGSSPVAYTVRCTYFTSVGAYVMGTEWTEERRTPPEVMADLRQRMRTGRMPALPSGHQECLTCVEFSDPLSTLPVLMVPEGAVDAFNAPDPTRSFPELAERERCRGYTSLAPGLTFWCMLAGGHAGAHEYRNIETPTVGKLKGRGRWVHQLRWWHSGQPLTDEELVAFGHSPEQEALRQQRRQQRKEVKRLTTQEWDRKHKHPPRKRGRPRGKKDPLGPASGSSAATGP